MSDFERVNRVFEQVLEVENTTDILDFVVPGRKFLIWPTVRYEILSYCLEHFFSGKFIFPNPTPQASTFSRYHLFFKMLRECITPWPKRDIWLGSFAGSAFYKNKDGRLYNHYIEPFAEQLPDQSLFVDFSNGPEFVPATSLYPLRRTAPISIAAGKWTRYFTDKPAKKVATDFLAFVKTRIKTILEIELPESLYKQLHNRIVFNCKFSAVQFELFSKIWSRRPPTVLILDELYYGGMGHIVHLCKDLGVTVCENQHGILHSTHLAYQWGDSLINSPVLQKELPDTFLSYGTYWHRFFRACGEPVAVGNPWYTQHSQNVVQTTDNHPILFALAGVYDELLPFISALLNNFPEREILLRPHPNEWTVFNNSSIGKLAGTRVDCNKNFYETLPKVGTVIGDLSTALYESAAMGKRVLLLRSPYNFNTDPRFFEWFDTPEELVEKLKQTDWAPHEDVYDVFFDRNWEENYKNIIEKAFSR